MGISLPGLSRETMKAFVLAFVAIAAVSAEPEAEADAYNYGRFYNGIHYQRPAVYTTGHTSLLPSYGYSAYSSPYASPFNHHQIGKREAEPEADAYTLAYNNGLHGLHPAVVYKRPTVYNHPSVYTTGSHLFPRFGYSTGTYQTYGSPAVSVNHHLIGKREAEADAHGVYYPRRVSYAHQSVYPKFGYSGFNGYNGYNRYNTYNGYNGAFHY